MSLQSRQLPRISKYRSGQKLSAETVNKIIDAVSILQRDMAAVPSQFAMPPDVYSFGLELFMDDEVPTIRVFAGSIVIHGYGVFTTGGGDGYTDIEVQGTPFYAFAKCPRTGGAATIDWANERPMTTLDEYRFPICKIEIDPESGVYNLTKIFRQGDIDLDTPIR